MGHAEITTAARQYCYPHTQCSTMQQPDNHTRLLRHTEQHHHDCLPVPWCLGSLVPDTIRACRTVAQPRARDVGKTCCSSHAVQNPPAVETHQDNRLQRLGEKVVNGKVGVPMRDCFCVCRGDDVAGRGLAIEQGLLRIRACGGMLFRAPALLSDMTDKVMHVVGSDQYVYGDAYQ